ncbi:MAG: hypothetical protein FWG84_03330 [Bacteroidales bacterium]|nr:hypothetical protein [Bacteroidales bacterium]
MNKVKFLTAIAAIIICAAACGGQQPKPAGNETNGDALISSEGARDPQQESAGKPTPADILTIYKKVLNSETAHFDAAKERNILLKEYFREYNANDVRFTIVDMDGDGIPEVAMEHDPGIVRVLRYENGTVYGYSFDFRAMSGIKKDGSFEWSNGAFNSGVGRQKFDGTYTDNFNIAEEAAEPGADNSVCYIYYNKVFENQHRDFMTAYWQKEEADWKPFTTQNVNSLKAWDALQYFYVNIPDKIFPIPMRQGAVIPYDSFFLPEEGYAITGYVYDEGDGFKESYKLQLSKAGFVQVEDAPDWIESLWRYDRRSDGAKFFVELLYGEDTFMIQMYVNYF